MKVGYARVSTQKSQQEISLEGQVRQLEEAGCELVISESKSAFQGRRPGWEQLWGLVASGQVSEVLVVDQSRLSRSGDDLDFLNACALKGVEVKAVTGGTMEIESYGGFIAAGVVSLMNRAQSRLTAIKVKDGIARRRAAGYYGCGKVPFGYAVIDGKPAPHPQHFEEARVMWLQLMEREMNMSGWIKDTGMPWTLNGVRKWIANPMLRGSVRGQWGQVEPVITWDEWERAQQMLKVRSTIRGQAAHRIHLFTALVKCEQCGKSMHNVVEKGRKPRLKCLARHCAWYGRGLRVLVVRERVIAALTQQHREMAERVAFPVPIETEEQRKLKTEIATLKQVVHLPGVEALIENLQQQLAAMTVHPVGPRMDLLSDLFADPQTLELATDQELRLIVLEFVASIVWQGGLESLAITLR